MKVTFVGIGSEQLAISLLSAVLQREGHETSLAFNPALFDYDGFFDIAPLARVFDRTDALIDEIVEGKPDLLAFSVLTAAYGWSLRVAREVKARTGVPVIFGGVHPSAVPEVCLENDWVDYVCVGEGEVALVALCDAIEGGAHRPSQPIPNLRWIEEGELVVGPPAPFLPDLDSLPDFDKHLWDGDIRIADQWMTMASRGCPYRCTFCFNNFFAKIPGKGGGRYLRRRSVDRVIGELVQAKADFGIRRVDFEDDIFTTDKDWIREFTERYRAEVDLPFQCLVHPRFVDHDMARWLKEAGCEHVQMGVQSVDEDYKRRELLRMEKDSHLRNALAALAAADLDLKLDHMLGLPGEPKQAQEQAREIYSEFPPRRIQTFWLVHLPGVELTTGAVARGDLAQADYDALSRGEVRRYHIPELDEGVQADADADYYRRYELLFRLLTVLPKRWAPRLRAERMPALPVGVTHALGMGIEVVNAAKNRDREAWNYLRFYAHQGPLVLRKKVEDRRLGRSRTRRKGPDTGRTVSFGLHDARTPDVPGAAASDGCGTDGCSTEDGAATSVHVELRARRQRSGSDTP